jgi:hypothetical protein
MKPCPPQFGFAVPSVSELTLKFAQEETQQMNISNKIVGLLTGTALVLAWAMPAAAVNGKPAAVPTAKPAPAAPAPPEKHPQIREALASLRNSKEHLEHAAQDFGGHRVEAIRAIDEAIHQLEICLAYDKD